MNAHVIPLRNALTGPARRRAIGAAPSAIVLRSASSEDAPAIHALIDAHVEEGHLLPRSLRELASHAARFVVACRASTGAHDDEIVGCAELAPLSDQVAEVRSLVVDRSARREHVGRRLLEQLQRRARLEGFERLCAFTHDAGYFVRKGFSIVPHVWLPEKIAHDCHRCPKFRRCGQQAVVLSLVAHSHSHAAGVGTSAAARG